jgi:2-polyprenyl-3-methyl-5-hydroxy-6-metoxy-1,4-benzoquinol methylase
MRTMAIREVAERAMAMPAAPGGDYDAYSCEYAPLVAAREEGGAANDPYAILPSLLDWLGELRGRRVLDAGCGEGYLARVLADRGAAVTGIDISPGLIEQARRKNPAGTIMYRAADLSHPQPDLSGSFDVVASYLVLNDVPGYQGFIATIADALRPGGRAALAFNNPYYAYLSRHVTDYFDSGHVSPYRGLWASGLKVYHYHRTLEDYLDAFLASGLRLAKLADLTGLAGTHPPYAAVPEGHRFPRFMLLGFEKPAGIQPPGEARAPRRRPAAGG